MTSRADIIKAQESIGNVEINKEKFDNLPDDCCKGWISITNKEDYEGYDSDIYFAPRDVIYSVPQKLVQNKITDEKIGCGKEDLIKLINNKINLIREEYPECGNAIGMFEDIKEKLK